MTNLYAPADVLVERMMQRVTQEPGGCWIFTGATTSRGYGCVGAGARSKSVLTHRLVVIARDGAIPDGMEVDHLCHDSHLCRDDEQCPHRRCVNPAHLAVVSGAANTARRWERGVCQKGHTLVPRGDGRRRCTVCASAYYAARRQAAKA